MEWEVGVSRCKLFYIEWINNKVLLYSTGNFIQYPMIGTSLAVQWLKLCASIAGGMGSISGWGTKILHAAWRGQKSQYPMINHNGKEYFF